MAQNRTYLQLRMHLARTLIPSLLQAKMQASAKGFVEGSSQDSLHKCIRSGVKL